MAVSKLAIALVASLCLVTLPGHAATLLLTFSGSVDASQFGLSSSTPLVFQVAYDPSQAPYPGSNAQYTLPISMTVGGYQILETGDVSLAIQPSFDSFSMGAAGYVSIGSYQETLSGLINGYDVNIGTLDAVNNVVPINMLSSTSLPTSADFITRANTIGVDIENFLGTRKIIRDFGPTDFTLTITAIPEPTTAIPAFLLILSLLAFRQRAARISPVP